MLSCKKKPTENTPSIIEELADTADNLKLVKHISLLRPNAQIELRKEYTDTVTFIKLESDYDYASMTIEKNKQLINLIVNKEYKFNRGDQLEINWKLDSFKEAGSGEDKIFESLVAAERIKDGFITALSKGESLSSYFSEDWTLVYHEDNRCDGWTDGFIEGLNTFMIDAAVTLQVTNDGKGWACEETNPKTFDYSFKLKEQVKNWDRFEVDEARQEDNSLYLEGAGESDYIILYFNEKGEIVKLEYRSEDPG